jgi:hypothetical protein
VVGRIEDALREVFGSATPRINIGFGFSYEFFGHHSVEFSLGHVDIPFSTFFRLMRDAIGGVSGLDAALSQVAADLATAFGKQFDLEARQDEHAAKTRERERLDGIEREHTASPKQIAVLSPASGSVHGGDVQVVIRLGGVPLSYLGLDKDEQQRVFILINGELVPPKTLVVGQAAAVANPALHTKDIRLDSLAGFDRTAGVFRGPGATIRVHTTSAKPAAPTGLSRSKGMGLERRVTAKKDGGTTTTTTLARYLPGRLLTPSLTRAIGSHLPPGLDLLFTVEMKDLIQGSNALAIVLIDRGGRRYEHVVSFGMSAPPAPPRPRSVVVRLPVRGKEGSGKLPPRGAPVRPAFGVGLTPASAKGGVTRASAYLKHQANLNFKDVLGPRR